MTVCLSGPPTRASLGQPGGIDPQQGSSVHPRQWSDRERSGHVWATAPNSCPVFFPGGEREPAQSRTTAICQEGQSQARQLSPRASKLSAQAPAPGPTFPLDLGWGKLSSFPLSQSPGEGMSRSSHLSQGHCKCAWE